MVHPAALAISFGVVLGGAIFALFFMNNNNRNSQHVQHERRARADPIELIANQLENDTCSICLERFDNDDVFLQCMHRFHDRCIEESLRHSKYCPNCRQPVQRFS